MNKKRRVFVAIMAIVICLLLVVPQVLTLFADDVPTGEIIVNFYDDKNSESVISNTRVEILDNHTISDLLSTLRTQNIIKSFAVNDKSITSITLPDGKMFSTITDNSVQLLILINASTINDSAFLSPLKNGDIVEIFYTVNPAKFAKTISSSPTSNVATQPLATVWTSDLTKVQNEAFEWLNRNVSTSTSYLMTAGITGKTADIKSVNTFLQEFSTRRDYQTPMEMAKDILTLTFSGYDASSEKYGKLISKLSNYSLITKLGIFGAVNTLIAYDCNNYYVPTTAINSRENLVEMTVGYQNDDGGFPVTVGSKSDVDTTAMTITALSSYRDYPNVAIAIDNAVEYLSNVQTDSGGFGFQGNDNLESLSTVIIALNSNGINLDDERFHKNGITLIENLIQYRNSDGGFAHIVGDKSTAFPTEQALSALTAIKKNSNPFKLSKLVVIDTTTEETEQTSMQGDNSITVVIIGSIVAIVAITTIFMVIIAQKKRSNRIKE